MARVHALKWFNPYTKPTGDELLRWGFSRFGDRRDEEMEQAVCAKNEPGSGYSLNIFFLPDDPPRMLAPETLVQVRRKRMETRMRKKYPLLAEQMIAAEYEENGWYFTLEECRRHQEEKLRIWNQELGLDQYPPEKQVCLPAPEPEEM